MTLKQATERIAALDLIRGYFLFVILIDHLGRFFGGWEIFTGRGAQWVSAAEGFFFVSGMMVGLVRGRKMKDRPFKEVWKKLWSRALLLYVWAVGLTLFFSAIAELFKGNAGIKSGAFSGTNFILETFTLQFNYGWGDFLAYYAIYLFLAPLAIWLIRKRLWHTVLLLSLIGWMTSMKLTGSWQILFFSGAVFGYYQKEVESYFFALKNKTKKLLTRLVYSLTLVTLSMSVFFTTFAEEYGKDGGHFLGLDLSGARAYSVEQLRPVFDKSSLAPLRLLLFYLWFTALYLLVRKYEDWFKQKLGWLLMTLGQNSLYVYIVHAILLYFLDLLIPGGQFWLVNFVISTSFVGLIWYMTKRKFLFGIIPR